MDNAAFEGSGSAVHEPVVRRRALIQRSLRLQPEEQRFLEAVRDGDILGLRTILQAHPLLDVNCCDMRGLRALEVAAQNGDVELSVELLRLRALDADHVQSALLVAIQRGDIRLTRILLDGAHGPCTVPVGNMTPLMAAAIAGDLEITKMLLDRGHTIQKPHEPGCRCAESCREQAARHGERLSQSQLRRNAFRALSSPVHILLTSDDPVLSAFTLSRELRELAQSVPEFQNEYEEMAEQCSRFAAAILGACKNTEEVETVLSQPEGFPTNRPFRFPRLSLAILLDQKNFVGHANCQQVLRSLWYKGLPGWPAWSTARKAAHVAGQALATPFLSVAYIFTPEPMRVLKPLRVPLNRFVHSCTSYATFLVLLTISLFYGRRDSLKLRVLWSEILVGVWIVGYVWELALSAWALGPRVFLSSWWAVYDVCMFGLFLVAEILWFIVFVSARTLQESIDRSQWPWYHPYLIGESLYAIATVLAFCRLLLWCQILQMFGPLTVSLLYMLRDVVRFMLLLGIVYFGFAVGISSIYKNYAGNQATLSNGTTLHQPPNFTSLGRALKYLFWALYELGTPEIADIVVSGDATRPGGRIVTHNFTEFVGYALWGLYHIVSVIVLLNVLIAMMTDSFQRVQGNAYTEWIFARSSQWISYLDINAGAPPPLNLFPTARCLRMCYKLHFAKKGMRKAIPSPSRRSTCFHDWEFDDPCGTGRRLSYQDLVVALSRRYLQLRDIADRELYEVNRSSSRTNSRIETTLYADSAEVRRQSVMLRNPSRVRRP
ncbi:short transient receptor potential channel 3-like [Dermacentor albipictus]|uniref:short transient receptor potential channel 3-like n=1 Tax=Dermacentor albipictus TaxID=60249 RepID=UPI0031FBD28B